MKRLNTSGKIDCWHFVSESRMLGYDADSLAVEPGYVYSIAKGETPEPCERGMHGSRRAIDALRLASGPIICRVRIWGNVREDKDKLVGRHREVLWMADATNALHRMAFWCREAQCEANDSEIDAAWTAWDAAWTAASATGSWDAAAWTAARDAQNTELERLLFGLRAAA